MAVIQHRGEYQWRAMVRRKGFPTYTRTFERQRDAQGWATDVEAAIGRRDLAEIRRLTATGEQLGGTIGALVTKFEVEVLPSRGQARSEKPRLARIKDSLGKLTVSMLTPQDVAKWRDVRLKSGASVGTVRHDLNTLSKLLGHAISEWGVDGLRNVVRDVKKPEIAKGRDRRVSELELEYLLRAATFAPADRPDEAPAPGLAPLITLAVETSMRLGELVALDWKRIDFKNRTAHLPKTKNGEARTVALSSKADSPPALSASRSFFVLRSEKYSKKFVRSRHFAKRAPRTMTGTVQAPPDARASVNCFTSSIGAPKSTAIVLDAIQIANLQRAGLRECGAGISWNSERHLLTLDANHDFIARRLRRGDDSTYLSTVTLSVPAAWKFK